MQREPAARRLIYIMHKPSRLHVRMDTLNTLTNSLGVKHARELRGTATRPAGSAPACFGTLWKQLAMDWLTGSVPSCSISYSISVFICSARPYVTAEIKKNKKPNNKQTKSTLRPVTLGSADRQNKALLCCSTTGRCCSTSFEERLISRKMNRFHMNISLIFC